MAEKKGNEDSRARSSDEGSSSSGSDSSVTLTPGNSQGTLTPINTPIRPSTSQMSPLAIGALSRVRIRDYEASGSGEGTRFRIPRSHSDPYFLSHPIAEAAVGGPAAQRAQPSWAHETQSGPSRYAYNPMLRSQYNFTPHENRGHYLRRRGSFSNTQSNLGKSKRNPRAGILDDDNLLLTKEQILRHTPIIKCEDSRIQEVERKKFNIIRGAKLGSGHYGSAFVATKVGSDRKLAIKIYNALTYFKMDDLEARGEKEEGARETLIESLHEIMIMKALKGHPYCAQYETHFIINDKIYLVMELADDTLEGQVTFYQGGMPEAKARKWFFEIAKGLTFMHKIGIVHRDIQHDNILIKRLGYKATIARISDFGLARFLPHASVEIKGDTRVGMVRARTVGRPHRPQDPQVKQLQEVMKIPRHRLPDRRIFDDSNMIQQWGGYESILNDQYDLGVTLLFMFGVDFALDDVREKADEIQNTPYHIFMNSELISAGVPVSGDVKDLLWKLFCNNPDEISTIKQLNPDRRIRLMKHHWFALPGVEPGFQRDPNKSRNVVVRNSSSSSEN